MNDAKQQWQEKWGHLRSLFEKVKFNPSDNEDYYCYWNFSKDNIELEVVIEFDRRNYTGIYYGCRAKKADESKFTSPIFDNSKIKDDYFKKYWSTRNPSNTREDMEHVFLLDDGTTGKETGTYWPFWIKLEDKYPVIEAIVATEVIIASLKAQGWDFIDSRIE